MRGYVGSHIDESIEKNRARAADDMDAVRKAAQAHWYAVDGIEAAHRQLGAESRLPT